MELHKKRDSPTSLSKPSCWKPVFNSFFIPKIKLYNSISKCSYNIIFFCYQEKKIEKFLKNDLNVGYTLIQSTNGIGFMKRTIIMCIIPTNLFYVLKKEIQRIDSHGILYSNDCYTVEGGKTNDFIPVWYRKIINY